MARTVRIVPMEMMVPTALTVLIALMVPTTLMVLMALTAMRDPYQGLGVM